MTRRLPFLVALAAVFLAAAPAAQAALKLGSCATRVDCGSFKVPLDHAGKVRGSITLSVTRYRAKKATKPPIFAFAGGPGQAASTVAETFANEDLKGVRGDRDLIVYDQRGTGGSGAIDCPGLQKNVRDLKAQAACVKKLGAKRPFYTTPDSVADVEDIRRAIGAPKIALFGVSYGTNVAVQYALKYPGRVERLVLDSVVQPEGQTIFEEDAIAALPRVLTAECAGKCGSPDIRADFAKAVAAMPVKGTYIDAKGNAKTDTMTARDLFDFLRAGDLDPLMRSELPAVIAAVARGDATPLLRLRHRLDALFTGREPDGGNPMELSSGLFAATVCEEAQLPWDRTTPLAARPALAKDRAAAQGAKIAPFDAATVLDGDNVTNCLAWPQSPTPPKVGTGPLPDVPVLIFEGEEDLRTPLEAGRSVAKRFRQAQLVAVPNQGHSVVGTVKACAQKAIRGFFAGKKVGAPCAKNRAPADVVPLAPASVVPTPQGAADAAAATLADLEREHAILDQIDLAARGGGLRAGGYTTKGATLRLAGYSYVPGLSLSGTVSDDVRTSGSLKVAAGPRSGTLTLRSGVLTGTLGTTSVRATVRRLRIPPPFGAGSGEAAFRLRAR